MESALETLVAAIPAPRKRMWSWRQHDPADLTPTGKDGDFASTSEMKARALQIVAAAESEGLRIALVERLGDRFFHLHRSIHCIRCWTPPIRSMAVRNICCTAWRSAAKRRAARKRRLPEQLLGYASPDLARLLGIPEPAEARPDSAAESGEGKIAAAQNLAGNSPRNSGPTVLPRS